MKKAIFITIFTGLFLTLAVNKAVAQSYHYMDKSGNIIFVDRLDQVPNEYRNQIPGFNPTPLPVKDKKAAQKAAREAAKKEKEKQRERKKKEKLANKKPKVKKRRVSQAEADEINRRNAEKAQRPVSSSGSADESAEVADEAQPSVDGSSDDSNELSEEIK